MGPCAICRTSQTMNKYDIEDRIGWVRWFNKSKEPKLVGGLAATCGSKRIFNGFLCPSKGKRLVVIYQRGNDSSRCVHTIVSSDGWIVPSWSDDVTTLDVAMDVILCRLALISNVGGNWHASDWLASKRTIPRFSTAQIEGLAKNGTDDHKTTSNPLPWRRWCTGDFHSLYPKRAYAPDCTRACSK